QAEVVLANFDLPQIRRPNNVPFFDRQLIFLPGPIVSNAQRVVCHRRCLACSVTTFPFNIYAVCDICSFMSKPATRLFPSSRNRRRQRERRKPPQRSGSARASSRRPEQRDNVLSSRRLRARDV